VLIFAGWYGFMGGIPAFTVGLLGFVLFVGVLTERSRSIWSCVLAHGSWKGLVQSYFSSSGAVEDRVFTGSRYLLDEFGWLRAVGMHSRRRVRVVAFPYPNQLRPVPEGADRSRVTGDVAVVPQHPPSARYPPRQRDIVLVVRQPNCWALVPPDG
jgi:hypothetical protein